jgi:hypothetical protein
MHPRHRLNHGMQGRRGGNDWYFTVIYSVSYNGTTQPLRRYSPRHTNHYEPQGTAHVTCVLTGPPFVSPVIPFRPRWPLLKPLSLPLADRTAVLSKSFSSLTHSLTQFRSLVSGADRDDNVVLILTSYQYYTLLKIVIFTSGTGYPFDPCQLWRTLSTPWILSQHPRIGRCTQSPPQIHH